MAPAKKSMSTAALAVKVILTIVAVVVVIILETTWPSEKYKPTAADTEYIPPPPPPIEATPETTTPTTTTPTTTTPTTTSRPTTTTVKTPTTTTKRRKSSREPTYRMDRSLNLLSNEIQPDKDGTVVNRKNRDEPYQTSDIVARSPVDDGNGDEMDVAHEEVERSFKGLVDDGNGDEMDPSPKKVERSVKGPVDDGNVDEMDVAREKVERSKKEPVFDGHGDELSPPPTFGAARRFVSMATRTQGVRNRVGLTLDGDSWPQIKPHRFTEEVHFVSDVEEDDDDYALIHRVDYTTYTLLHASVYTYIGVFVTLICAYIFVDSHPPLESTLMFAGVVLHLVTIYFMSVLAHSFSKRSLHYTLTIVVIVLMVVMTLLMLLDCVLMWMLEGKRKPRRRLRKPPRKRIT